MLDIMNNIDPINYIVQDVLQSICGSELVPKNNFYTGEGYSMDIQEIRKNNLKLKVRTDTLQDLCNINMNKKNLVLRYSPDLFFIQDASDLYSTNLFEDKFLLQELPEMFAKHSTAFGLGVEFDFDNMIYTLELCRRVHDEFKDKLDIQG